MLKYTFNFKSKKREKSGFSDFNVGLDEAQLKVSVVKKEIIEQNKIKGNRE